MLWDHYVYILNSREASRNLYTNILVILKDPFNKMHKGPRMKAWNDLIKSRKMSIKEIIKQLNEKLVNRQPNVLISSWQRTNDTYDDYDNEI
jgi:predicted metallo-beta-lactamase superfamily hydrolase